MTRLRLLSAPPVRPAYTLAETILALALASLVGLAVTMMLSALGGATEARFNTQDAAVHRQIGSLRVASGIRGSTTILGLSDDRLVMWRGDANGDGVPSLSELKLFEFREQDRQLWLFQRPEDAVPALEVPLDPDDDFVTIAGNAAGTGDFPGQRLLDHVKAWEVHVDEADLSEARIIRARVTLDRVSGESSATVVASLRGGVR